MKANNGRSTRSRRLTREMAGRHALVNLPEVVLEYEILRDCIVQMWGQDHFESSHNRELGVLNQAIGKRTSPPVWNSMNAR